MAPEACAGLYGGTKIVSASRPDASVRSATDGSSSPWTATPLGRQRIAASVVDAGTGILIKASLTHTHCAHTPRAEPSPFDIAHPRVPSTTCRCPIMYMHCRGRPPHVSNVIPYLAVGPVSNVPYLVVLIPTRAVVTVSHVLSPKS